MRNNIVIPESILQTVNNALLSKYGPNVFSIELENNKKEKFYACSWDMTQKQEEEIIASIGNNPRVKIDRIKREEDKRKFNGFDKKNKQEAI